MWRGDPGTQSCRRGADGSQTQPLRGTAQALGEERLKEQWVQSVAAGPPASACPGDLLETLSANLPSPPRPPNQTAEVGQQALW